MTEPDFSAIRAEVLTARALSEPERSAHLAALAESNPGLHTAVQSLLSHDAPATPVIDPEALGSQLAGALDAWRDDAPEQIGPYRILDVLGEGGMGIVYRADQTEPLRREVAIKRMRRGIDTPAAIARFQAEAQALARLQHPHIAAVYDAGVDPGGRPYLVMELVDGTPVTDWVNEHDVPLAPRLDLFLQLTDAIAHAHQRGVIHRDLKPSNILVAGHGDQATIKVIDFGIAKATEVPLGDATLTLVDQLVGTPAYMSPEQAGAFGGQVDTRTDVYALGVVLFELLTGTRPLDFPSSLPEDIRAVLADQMPPAPSSVTQAIGERALRGDLDTITLQALRKEPDRRYASIEQLADDLRRHRDGRPVLARGDGVAYLAGRFLRRHTTAVVFASVAVLSLAGFAGLMSVQAQRLEAERNRALAAEQEAKHEADSSDRVTQFLVELFDIADPNNNRGEVATARDVLHEGVRRLKAFPPDDPLVKARLMASLGDTYIGISMYDEALPLLQEAVALQESVRGPNHVDVAETIEYLATVEHDLGDYEASIAHMRRVVPVYRQHYGDVHEETARVLNALAVSLDATAQYEEAEQLYRETIAIQRQVLGAEDPELAWSINTLGQAVFRSGRWAEATPLFEEALQRLRATPDPSPFDLGSVLNNVGSIRLRNDDLPGAEAALTEAVEVFEGTFGEMHAAVGRGLVTLSDVLRDTGRIDQAEADVLRGRSILSSTVGQDHPLYAGADQRLVDLRMVQGRIDEARAAFEHGKAVVLATYPEHHPTVLHLARRESILLDAEGRHAEAKKLRAATCASWAELVSASHPDLGRMHLEVALDALIDGDDASARTHADAAAASLDELPAVHSLRALHAAVLGALEGDDAAITRAIDVMTARYGAGSGYVGKLKAVASR